MLGIIIDRDTAKAFGLEELLKCCDEAEKKQAEYRKLKREMTDSMQDAIAKFSDACDTEEKFEILTKQFGEFMETVTKSLDL